MALLAGAENPLHHFHGLVSGWTHSSRFGCAHQLQVLLVVAAVGTMLYFIQTIKAKYVTHTDKQDFQERYTQIVDYHGKTVGMSHRRIENNKLANVNDRQGHH